MDTDEGQDEAPLSLHEYLYSEDNPIDNIDPSGNEIDEIAAGSVSETLDSIPSMALVGTQALKLARFASLIQNYPGHGAFPTDPNAPNSIRSTIGGHVQMNAWTKDSKGNRVPNNSCAVRMSYDLNRSGFTIPREHGSVSGADGSQYFLRVVDLQQFLIGTLGQPQYLPGGTFTGPRGLSGIISFNIPFRDATGHFTLWTGQAVIDPDEPYSLWPTPTSILFWRIN